MIISSGDQMRALGASFASKLRAGDLVLLSGPLGAGKTTFTQGLGAELNVEGDVLSPTFVIARYHAGVIPLIHVDAYRLRPEGGGVVDPLLALEDLDLDPSRAITVMEWGDDLAAALTDSYLEISINFIDDSTREVAINKVGRRWEGVEL